jgi:hypothetical protein
MNPQRTTLLLACCIALACCAQAHPAAIGNHRATLSLNGQWDVDDSIGPDDQPKHYNHKVPVPGLTHSAFPAFPQVDEFQTRQLISDFVEFGGLSKADYDKTAGIHGTSQQQRNYFWYRRAFVAPPRHAVALLKINKAQFGAVVFLNGVRIGEHLPCFSAAILDVTQAIHWNAQNELVIRIGAHPGVLPPNVIAGTDFEKYHWTPGIYDDVSLMAMNNPVISTIQVAPQLATSSILVQTVLHNYANHPIATSVEQQVFEFKSGVPSDGSSSLGWKSGASASTIATVQVQLGPGATQTVTQTVPIPKPHLWSPEDPFLYLVATTTHGDQTTTRFGMRDFRFDTVTQRAYLNGRPYFLRGSNITLHRFFEDPDVGTLPWDEAWLHRLLVTIPKQLHWNSFRFCIGPVPDRWLEIADESGLLIENEYPVWVGAPGWLGYDPTLQYDTKEMIAEYSEWMRDNWNHPSVAIWDASNESYLPEFSRTIIPAVRGLDLSNRPWENSYNTPSGANDPVEDHQYLIAADSDEHVAMKDGRLPFEFTDLETMLGPTPGPESKTGHAMILNEYGWLWLNRDGSPTLVTQYLYPRLLGDKNTAANRLAMQAYILGGETEFWRSYRRYAGVLHFVYLTSSHPKAFTSDHWLDLKKLELQPDFERAMENAFNPLGVYLNFWHPALPASADHNFAIDLVNDEDRPRSGKLRLAFIDAAGKDSAATEIPFSLAPLGAESYLLTLKTPAAPGSYSLQAIATPADDNGHPTISHRDVVLQTPRSQ